MEHPTIATIRHCEINPLTINHLIKISEIITNDISDTKKMS